MITISPTLNGFVVSVGCQCVVFDSVGKLACAIAEYYQNPEATEKKFIKERVNNTMDNPVGIVRSTPDNPVPTREPRAVVDSLDRERRPYNPSGVDRGPVCSPAPQESTGECCAEPVPRNPPSLR